MIAFLAAAIAMAAAGPLWPASTCRPYVAGAGLAEGAALGAALQRDWPGPWRSRGALADVTMSPEDMARTVTALSCVASWPGQEEPAIAAATSLFGSKRYGAAAFAAADALARDTRISGPMRAAVKGFRANMVHAVALKYDRI